MAALEKRLAQQERESEQQRKEITRLRAQLEKLRAPKAKTAAAPKSAPALKAATPPAAASAVGAPAQVRVASQPAQPVAMPERPVGQNPNPKKDIPEASALPENVSVLTPPGSFVFTPSFEYTRSSSNRLVFRGVEIVPGLQLGLIDANDVARDTVIGALNLRAGLFDRLEMEVRLPYVYRNDRLTTLSQQIVSGTAPATQTTTISSNGLGDVEASLRYQFNGASGSDPIYIGSIRVKSPTGVGPYNVRFDNTGIASTLATGTGFWAAGPGFLMIVPSDPAVMFVNLSWMHSFGQNIGKTIGTTPVGEVDPGDSFDLAAGFGLALNQRFSFSLGYNHTLILPTTQKIGATLQRSSTLQAGSLSFGMSYQLAPGLVISNSYLFGVTSDAPDLSVVFRIPIKLG